MTQRHAATLLKKFLRGEPERKKLTETEPPNPWWGWISGVRQELAALPEDDCPKGAEYFYAHFRRHEPCLVKLPKWPAFNWTMKSLRQRVGTQRVQVQVDRNSDPDYEVHSDQHRGWMTFNEFVDRMEAGDANDVYLTAQNRTHNMELINALADDLKPMPSFLTPHPHLGYLWLGRETTTPLHHDVTTNVMCQVLGRKQVRLIPPEFYDKVDHRSGVHTNIMWPSIEWATERGVTTYDYWLEPGMALHLPVGWWHAVKTQETSLTVVYTNVRWTVSPHVGFVAVGR